MQADIFFINSRDREKFVIRARYSSRDTVIGQGDNSVVVCLSQTIRKIHGVMAIVRSRLVLYYRETKNIFKKHSAVYHSADTTRSISSGPPTHETKTRSGFLVLVARATFL